MKFLASIFSIVMLTTVSPAFAQQQGPDISSMPLSKVKLYLQEQLNAIKALQKMEGMSIELKPASVSEEEKYDTPLQARSKSDIARDLDSLFSGMEFMQGIRVPDSYFALLEDERQHTKAVDELGFQPKYTLKKIFFSDGSTQSFNLPVEAEFDLPEIIKPVDKIEIDISYSHIGSIHKTTVSKNNPQATVPGGLIKLETLKGNTVKLFLSGIDKDEQLVKVEAVNSRGQALAQSHSSYKSFRAEASMEQYGKYAVIYETALKNFNTFKSAAEVEKYLEAEMGKYTVPEKQQQSIYGSYTFHGEVAAVNIFLKDSAVTASRTLTLPDVNAGRQYIVAQDTRAKLIGLMDRKGQWFIKPAFQRLKRSGVPNFYTGLTADAKENDKGIIEYQYFKLDTNARTLTPAGFELIEQLNDDLVMVQRETNGPYGIYDLKADKLVLPMNYVNLEIKGELLTCRIGQRTYATEGPYGGFNIRGKAIVPAKYRGMDTDSSFFYTKGGEAAINGKHLTRIDSSEVFDASGKKINPDGTFAIGTFVGNQPLLTVTPNEKYAFIDPKGQRVIDAAKYDEVQPFSNGMAVVKKGEQTGAINIKGELTVPLAYRSIGSFQQNYALAERGDGKKVLIDKNNKVAKVFPGFMRSSSIPANSNGASYYFHDNGRVTGYDADGNTKKD